MNNETEDILIREIERIRKELHQKVGTEPIKTHDVLMKDDLLELSRDLDKLIIQYMNRKK
ncbi:aspartyl-phosphate phosphatase Spo0E family protein [Tepidibacillus fermentans]|uniref:Spo0E like sporulation regulatory protein n=1 Tax=Tepidibacillus fermentans TaxID=1281767 RepID=A0A4R3KHP7_9BACI|nr:aspartyl-phosphate phosphatase Spo0E family protein [Tepidibacillus fermentans]TCS82995.1 Spo0E like sporulation regulatory protein [Tepidibacillus fermentans]